MRSANSFFISVGIHLSLAALMIGTLSAVRKNTPAAEEKMVLNLLTQTPAPKFPEPVAKPQPPVQPKVPLPAVKPPEARPVPQPKKTVTEQSKPFMNTPVQTAPLAPNVSSVPPARVTEQPIQPQAIKAVPPAQKQQERYEEENLGRIRSILMERLTYPKNALRLKQEGEATVTFTFEPDREVSQISITKSSGFDLLDEAAKNLIISSASEFPKPSKTVRISVPIAYKLR
ncbi:TonB family protein [Sulfuricurvum kujiense DSM 16994]|uniref:TonB family protein n=1 Tax=Sulfuricurvum kujiense (strain ATCC BAA-921 / DSM 16994 / JCM 11577 / YK-1) TaxID=709032 RepID=E4TWS4_SULKY|nr:energy transducer TonB [Sulfuricurvum kujiense]ADR32755.1 TonB family protein [Sulfuricurvum kujiense DSM 16994]